MAIERQGVSTFKGNPIVLLGPEVKIGDSAPGFQLLSGDMQDVGLDAYSGKVLIISVVPSLDTQVCDAQTRRFNEAAASLGADVKTITVSVDLPFAQKRFCSIAGIDNVDCLSDHRDVSFGEHYGVLIKGIRLLMRSIFVVDRQGVVQYAEYVKELTAHPDYDSALAAAKNLI